MTRIVALLALLLPAALLPLPAPAQTQTQTQTTADLVRWIYLSQTSPGPAETKGFPLLSAPAQRRQFFSPRMADFFDSNDSYGDDLTAACIDFGLDIPGQDFDPAEIALTLTVSSVEDAGKQFVTARFTNFGQPAQITYEFAAVDGGWRIDDIAGPGYRVSEIPCAPRAGAAPAAPEAALSNSYCFVSGSDQIRVDVSPTGDAAFSFESWQGGGHSCAGQGIAWPAGDRWVYADPQFGPNCRIEIAPTPDGGMRLADPDWACKNALCGARAVIDGLTFPATARVDCAQVPAR